MNAMMSQALVWIGAAALLLLYVSRRRKRKMTD
jgi:LPXTG-motif cell wall-anchored protein